MKKVKKRLMRTLLFFYVLVGIAVGLVLYKFFPNHYFNLYPAIPGYYTILGFILFRSLLICQRKCPAKMINIYMMLRGIKFLITILTVLLYNVFSDEFVYEFSITTVGFYFFYMFIETFIFIKFEKERIKK